MGELGSLGAGTSLDYGQKILADAELSLDELLAGRHCSKQVLPLPLLAIWREVPSGARQSEVLELRGKPRVPGARGLRGLQTPIQGAQHRYFRSLGLK
jgi:hypothetical protein